MFIKDSAISRIELQRLIEGCVSNDRTCQKTIYDMYAPSLLTLCMRFCRNQQESEEVLQDGFMRAFINIHQFKNTGSFGGWLRKILINCALQKYRGKYNKFHTTALSDDLPHLPTRSYEQDTLFEKELIRLIQALPPAYRMVFNLHVFEGLKHREIALTLGITEGTSKSNLFDARAILKKQLSRDFKIAR